MHPYTTQLNTALQSFHNLYMYLYVPCVIGSVPKHMMTWWCHGLPKVQVHPTQLAMYIHDQLLMYIYSTYYIHMAWLQAPHYTTNSCGIPLLNH